MSDNLEGKCFKEYEESSYFYKVVYDVPKGEEAEDRTIMQGLFVLNRNAINLEKGVLEEEPYVVKWAGDSREGTTLIMDMSGHIYLVNLEEYFPEGIIFMTEKKEEYQVIYGKGFFAADTDFTVTDERYANLDEFYKKTGLDKNEVHASLIKTANKLDNY